MHLEDTRTSRSPQGAGGRFLWHSLDVEPDTSNRRCRERHSRTGDRFDGGVHVRVYPDGSTPPGTSDLNFSAGPTVANIVVVQVGSDGMIDIFNSAGNEDAIVDVYGYYSTVKPDVTGLLDRDRYRA